MKLTKNFQFAIILGKNERDKTGFNYNLYVKHEIILLLTLSFLLRIIFFSQDSEL